MTSCAVSPQAAIVEPGTCGFRELHRHPEKHWTPRVKKKKKRIHSKKEIPALQPTPIYKLSTVSMAWNTYIGQLGCLSGCAPAHLLISWTWQTGERPWLLSNS